MPFDNILKRLSQKEVITPYLENAIMADNWPDQYMVPVDSSPYYGKGDGYFHPSTHPLMGARQLYYMFHPETRGKLYVEPKRLTSQMIFAMGSALHAVVQTQFQMTGLLEPEDVEVEYVNHDHHVRGRIDFILNHPSRGRTVVEMKTLVSRMFGKLEEIKPEWDAQLSIALDNMGASEGILLVVERGDPFRIREFVVPRNDALLSEIYTKFDYVRECIALNTPPKACCAPDSKEMKDCPARFKCWLSENRNDWPGQ